MSTVIGASGSWFLAIAFLCALASSFVLLSLYLLVSLPYLKAAVMTRDLIYVEEIGLYVYFQQVLQRYLFLNIDKEESGMLSCFPFKL